ncbi:MAG: HAMP domain-containing histidine kinase [Gemmatimonadaceae bacterium]|nr:HAMP domain-containing histidine kinase [Gemmatimonadaceae bacterium]
MTTSIDETAQLRTQLAAREAELERLRAELAETNRGVVALYGELETQADALRRASDLKSSFLSNVSHELRTPIASVINLARLLLEDPAGAHRLDAEQKRQLGYIQRAGETLYEMVSSLLDLARIEAGRMQVTPSEVLVDDLLSALRGLFRPLVTNREVALVFDDVPTGLTMRTDEGKLAQILRNLIGNALKFTERGEIRVTATPEGADAVRFTVADTGIGIPPEHQERIFHEFEQVAGALQSRAKGVGLGLPLSRSFAQLLGGSLTLESAPGAGSTFILRLPRRIAEAGSDDAATTSERALV